MNSRVNQGGLTMVARRQFALSKQRKLLKRIKEVAIEKGAEPTPDGSYQFQLQTCVGLLHLALSEGHTLASVFGRFDEPERAVELIGRQHMNPYSGKWNRHWSKDDDPESALLLFKADLERLTADVPGTASMPT
jgi:hypothetical protein